MEKVSLSLEWNRDGVMHSESGDDDDDEPARDEMTVTGTHQRQVGQVLWEFHSGDEVKHGGMSGC